MTTYVFPYGRQVLVCDTCGCDDSGTRPDLTNATPYDFDAVLGAAGFPGGTSIKVTDTCPRCNAAEKQQRGRPS